MPRAYDLADVELIKRSPLRMTLHQGGILGQCETILRQKGSEFMGNMNLQLHQLIQAAMASHRREETPCPWTDDYERKPLSERGPEYIEPVTCQDQIVAYIAIHGRSRAGDIGDAMEKLGYSANTAKSEIPKACADGLIVRKEQGVYDIARKGAAMANERGWRTL